jgi:hypothetical protein
MKRFFISTVSVLLTLVIAESVLHLFFWGKLSGYGFIGGCGSIKKTDLKNTLPGFEQNVFDINPVIRHYGHLRNESRYLYQHFNGKLFQNVLKVWNKNYVLKCISQKIPLAQLPISNQNDNNIYVFQPTDSNIHPAYRYFPSSSVEGLSKKKFRFNSFGWSGSDISLIKPANTIRIAFVGGSTTQQMGQCDFAYPDYIEAWLNAWAKYHCPGIHFEVINAARVAQRSSDIVAIYKHELIPAEPDIIVYYEGRNQFDVDDILGQPSFSSFDSDPYYYVLSHSMVLQLLANAVDFDVYHLLENRKQKYLTGKYLNIDLGDNTLPVQLPGIINDLDTLRTLINAEHKKLVICSFAMLTADSVLVHPRNGNIYQYWLSGFGKMKVDEIAELNRIENKVFGMYAQKYNLPFINVAEKLPVYSSFFIDGVHLNCDGMKIHAWIVYQQLLPIIKHDIDNKMLPDAAQYSYTSHPYLKDSFELFHYPEMADLK